MGGKDWLIKCPYNGFNSVQLMEYSGYRESKCTLLKQPFHTVYEDLFP